MKTNHDPLNRERQILVIIKKPGHPPMVEPLFPNELEAFQKAVGGHIETVTLASDLVLLVNEEGLLQNLPYNTTVLGMPLFGAILALGVNGPEFSSLKASQVPAVMALLGGTAHV